MLLTSQIGMLLSKVVCLSANNKALSSHCRRHIIPLNGKLLTSNRLHSASAPEPPALLAFLAVEGQRAQNLPTALDRKGAGQLSTTSESTSR